MNKIKFTVIGFGHIGKRYVDLIVKNPNAEIVAIVDNNENLLLEASTQYNVAVFNSLEKLLQSNTTSHVICIATPNYLHCSQALLALNNNLHVVIEKPMGLSSNDCLEVINTAQQLGKHVFCVMQNRYSPPSAWLKEVINTKKIGAIYYVQINCFWNRDERYYANSSWKGKKAMDGGTLFTQFSHFVDTLYWVFGDIKNISTRLYNYNHASSIEFEDSGNIYFDLVNGGNGNINYSTSVWNKNLESSITIIGQKGSIKIGGQYMDKVLQCEIENYVMPTLASTNEANNYGSYTGSAANHQYVIENIIDVLQGNSIIKTSAQEGMKVVEIIERIYNEQMQ